MTERDVRNPWMADDDRIAILRVLTEYRVKWLRVLEWGAGGSTHYFSSVMRRYRIKHDWLAIEHDPVWASACAEVKLPTVNIVTVDAGTTDRKALREATMDAYVDLPGQLDQTWHVIIIDGRKRRRCLIAAKTLLKPGGCVLLHDADRAYYRCGMDGYTGTYLTPTLWMGRVDNACGQRVHISP